MIPTAYEFCQSHNLVDKEGAADKTAEEALIEFVRLHVEAALEAAADKTHKNGIPRIVDNKESILNAYPLDNIK